MRLVPVATALAVLATLVTACQESTPAGAADPSIASNGTGPLAQLESAPFQNEVWIGEDGQQQPILYYPRENVRISGACRSAAGQFTCAAMTYMRNGQPVELAARALDGRTSAGTKVCMRMNQPIVMVHNSVGAEDSFCRFPDGSLVSNGALEQYKMRVIQ